MVEGGGRVIATEAATIKATITIRGSNIISMENVIIT